MALNIKNREVERLAAEVSALTGESKTQAIRSALEARKATLRFQVVRPNRRKGLLRFLEREIWPATPKKERGRRLTRKEEDAILGYGRQGV